MPCFDGGVGTCSCEAEHTELVRKPGLRKPAGFGASKSKRQTLNGTDYVPPTRCFGDMCAGRDLASSDHSETTPKLGKRNNYLGAFSHLIAPLG